MFQPSRPATRANLRGSDARAGGLYKMAVFRGKYLCLLVVLTICKNIMKWAAWPSSPQIGRLKIGREKMKLFGTKSRFVRSHACVGVCECAGVLLISSKEIHLRDFCFCPHA
jgi:hypothetical protein